MRKQEYIHLHAALVEAARYLVEEEGIPNTVLSEYDVLETRPSSAHDSKQAHHRAVVTLASAIEARLEQDTPEGADPLLT